MTSKYFAFGAIKPFHYFFSVSVFLAFVFSFVSYNEQSHYLIHLLLWLLQTTGPILILVYGHIYLHKLSAFRAMNVWLKLFVSGLLGALIFSPLALALDLMWEADSFPQSRLDWYQAWLGELSGVLPPITLSWMAINAPWILGFRFVRPSSELEHDVQLDRSDDMSISNDSEKKHGAALSEQFIGLVNPVIGKDIVFIKSELHYVLVVTTLGKDLVLYNLRDAIKEIPHLKGSQPHRSYWVNHSHIKHLHILGRQGYLLLSNGDKVPVSRSKLSLFDTYIVDDMTQSTKVNR